MPQPYLLLTPGPLSTSDTVKAAMQVDLSTWDSDYLAITERIRSQLLTLAGVSAPDYSAVLLQGSGSYGVEAVLNTLLPKQSKDACLMVASNGAYGARIAEMADRLQINHVDLIVPETKPVTAALVTAFLDQHPEVTHFAMIHCETTTGILNPIETILPQVKDRGIITIVDAMSSFGGIPINLLDLKIDFLISSANKCIQGVPGFAFVMANCAILETCQGRSTSLSLDLYDQHMSFKMHPGKWRFTSPTHTVLAFDQALSELIAEGGVAQRYQRYTANQRQLVNGMQALGYQALLPTAVQSPIITTFKTPNPDFDFNRFYQALKDRQFVIYPGKTTAAPSFRIGTIGVVDQPEISALLAAIESTQKLTH
ncbi:2-aminoethylphosphonate--pyruvate transaminase [Latilactobacillus fuchuensis]|uniref:2-aminoethylphosphonate--pyruvate transaminase n=2 Tax=Latilactobacillus fuchuensis TaxID=164393 RepID=A0A2N9DTZ0_9LACO|nr:2-aminoethylphosphonate--pyruvate transaminase [Latilactobacillus fuchuensis]KRL61015.1 2-aminoethylphosphonate--pyruvate transaminase [Latilactobacillus fuchuensis DSM 14340 = JCM 11249]SPC37057.1 2-aminoethylphosphonate--pyruvate transaminase [Latilactobacillus fuchuensis]